MPTFYFYDDIPDERESKLRKIIADLGAASGDYWGAYAVVHWLADAKVIEQHIEVHIEGMNAALQQYFQREKQNPPGREKFYRKFQKRKFR